MDMFKFRISGLFIAALLLFSCSKSEGTEDGPNGGGTTVTYAVPKTADNNVVAHRGAYKENGFPDNSMAALRSAISLGCFASECDIHITKDGKVVVFHDDTFKGLAFKDATYAELCAAGTLSNGEKLPLFDEFIDAVLKAGTTILFVDVKSLDDQYGGNDYSILAGQAASTIVRNKLAKNFVKFIIGREPVLLKCIEAARGDWECGYMNGDTSASTFKSKGYTWANFDISYLYQKQDLIQTYKDLGIRISTYNADTDIQMTWFLTQNMYAVCTNYPTKLLSLVRGK